MARVRRAEMNLKRIQDDQAQIAELERRTMAILEHKPFGLPLTAFERKELAMLKEDIAVVGAYGAMQTALAVTFGLLLALAVGRALSQILYDVSPNDLFALVTSSLLLATASLLACFFPARRATKVSAMTALRTE